MVRTSTTFADVRQNSDKVESAPNPGDLPHPIPQTRQSQELTEDMLT